MSTLETIDDFYDVFYRNFLSKSNSYTLPSKTNYPIDIYVDDIGAHFEVPCTGIPKEDIEVSIEDSHLRIKYEKDLKNSDIGQRKYLAKGVARRAFDLGYKLTAKYNISKAEATFKDGLLLISIPFSEKAKPKQLKIK